MELYNVKQLKCCIAQVLYTPAGSRCRHHSSFIELNVFESRYVFILYSGKQRFIEIGFNDTSVYKILRFFLSKYKSINDLILRIVKYAEVIRQ